MHTPSEYERARRRARLRANVLDAITARRIAEALADYADRLAEGIARLPASGQLAARRAVEVIREQAAELERRIVVAISGGVDLSANDTLAIWQRASERLAEAQGDVPDALLGAIGTGNVTQVEAFLRGPSALTWRSLVRGHVVDAAERTNAIVARALAEGVSPRELSRRLRPVVAGGTDAERQRLAALIDPEGKMGRVPGDLAKAAAALKYNADRIAVTEIHNARAGAETAHFAADPLVYAIRWALSPNRGEVVTPDVCDVLASEDFYGLGPGMYPVAKVPPSPHPFDRCERVPVVRSIAREREVKPNPPLQKSPSQAVIPNVGRLTPRAAERIREQLALLLAA